MTRLQQLVALSVALALSLNCCRKNKAEQSSSEHAPQKEAALEAANSWLELLDSGRYDRCWDEAAAILRNAVTTDDWSQKIQTILPPLGKVVRRTVVLKHYATILPGVPRGEYVVIQYRTIYENKPNAIETVTPTRDADGTWRVAGYFIK